SAGASSRHMLIGSRRDGSLGAADLDDMAAAEAEAMLAQGNAGSRLLPVTGEAVLVEAFVPVTQLLVLGAASLADALSKQAEILGWRAIVVDDGSQAEAAVAKLRPADAMVVLGHAEAFDPAIAAG